MRRKLKKKIIVLPDYKYDSYNVQKLVNYLMKDGEKSVARRVVYSASEEMGKQTKKEPLAVLDEALKNVMPVLEVRSRRVGGANYQVPREVAPNRALSLALRWIVGAARSQKGKPMHLKLAGELVSASKNEGEAIKKRENTHKMAEANKAFAHFAW